MPFSTVPSRRSHLVRHLISTTHRNNASSTTSSQHHHLDVIAASSSRTTSSQHLHLDNASQQRYLDNLIQAPNADAGRSCVAVSCICQFIRSLCHKPNHLELITSLMSLFPNLSIQLVAHLTSLMILIWSRDK